MLLIPTRAAPLTPAESTKLPWQVVVGPVNAFEAAGAPIQRDSPRATDRAALTMNPLRLTP